MESLGVVAEPIEPQAGLIQESTTPAQPVLAEEQNTVATAE